MFVVVNSDALAQASDIRIERRQVVFLCWMQDSNPRSQTPIRRQTDWAIEDQAKNLNSTARPYDQQAFSPLDLTASWLSHLALAIYIFAVVNFDALAQASDIRIHTYIHTYMHACLLLLISMLWHRQAIFETKHYDVKSQSFNPGLQYPHLHGPVHTPDNNRWDTPPV